MKTASRHRGLIVLTATAALIVSLAASLGIAAWRQHAAAADRLAELAPRYARLLGLRAADRELDERLRSTRDALSRLAYGPERDAARIGNDLQQQLRAALQSAGLVISSSQVMPARQETGRERISVTAQIEGPLDGLQQALATIQTQRPLLFVDTLSAQPTARVAESGIPVVASRMTVSVLRVVP